MRPLRRLNLWHSPWLRPKGHASLRVVSLVSLVSLGCEKPTTQQLTDTEGRVFDSSCQDGRCSLTQRSGPVAKIPGAVPRIMTPSRLLAVCDVKPGTASAPPDACRPLVCESDENCPVVASGSVRATCIGNLCVEPLGEIRAADSIMLCLAGTGLGRSTGRQAERYALGLNCGNPCKVPSTCRQP